MTETAGAEASFSPVTWTALWVGFMALTLSLFGAHYLAGERVTMLVAGVWIAAMVGTYAIAEVAA